MMEEKICQFGPQEGLSGILTIPAKEIEKSDAPVAIILNAGIVHRIGPFRLHVDIARQLAMQGFKTLRIDLSGLGESKPRTGKLEDNDRALLDVSDAMDFMESEYGAHAFSLIGLCSGAFNAHQIAVRDARVVGAAFLDGIVFPTFGYYLRHRIGRLVKPRFWRNVIKRRLAGDIDSPDSSASGLAESEFFGGEYSQEEVTRDILSMRERDVQMLFVWTEGFDDVCGRGQFKEMFGFQPDEEQIQVEYYQNAEHTFRLTENRMIVCRRISNWFNDRFSPSEKGASSS